jgi:hypothetical protein
MKKTITAISVATLASTAYAAAAFTQSAAALCVPAAVVPILLPLTA